MDGKIRLTFLMLIAVQALHSVEEFSFKFYEVFPPMRLLYRDAPHLAGPAFIISNIALATVGLVCLLGWVWPARRGARAVVWAWVGGEAFNVIAHCVWAILVRGYNPGLVTGFGLVPVVVYLSYLLRRSPPHAGT
jgi:hypothetical protein